MFQVSGDWYERVWKGKCGGGSDTVIVVADEPQVKSNWARPMMIQAYLPKCAPIPRFNFVSAHNYQKKSRLFS